MKLYSTNDKDVLVDLEEAVLHSQPKDGGLYMPISFGRLDSSIIDNIEILSFPELAFEVSKVLIGDYIPKEELRKIVESAIDFPAPLVKLKDSLHILELFHGPSLAFKDFGARFMSKLMAYFLRGINKKVTILVATSGDTGGAVAAGFYNTPGIEVIILYPSGKVSALQEKQLTTLGGNITALEVDGTFDDCQALVKQAFIDHELSDEMNLSSANSINIARLIPQSFYYFEGYRQLEDKSSICSFVVPSGNFGNITAGLIAKKIGLPVGPFIAATNVNDVVPRYLISGNYTPEPTIATISNAMDVGKPSNFARILDLYGSTWNDIKDDMVGFSFSDAETRVAMKNVFQKYDYIIDPHGAVGILAAEVFLQGKKNTKAIVLETAHPAKFIDEVNSTLDIEAEIPNRLKKLAKLTQSSIKIDKAYADFKSYLLSR